MAQTYRELLQTQYNLFNKLTEFFTLDDWRLCRNSVYWESDKIEDPYKKLKYKNQCIINYLEQKNGKQRQSN